MLETTPNLVVCISEGIHDKNGTFVCELAGDIGTDTFGHKMLTGSGKYLENLVKERIGVKVRSIELNVCQRCSSEYLSATDLNESENAGIVGVQAALKGETGKMITFIRNCDFPYELSYETADVNEICNMEKAVPSDWITEDGCDVTEAFIQYGKTTDPRKSSLARKKTAYRFLLTGNSLPTIRHKIIVITISGSVFPTGISIFIRIRYAINPITQIIIFGTCTA